MRSQSDPNWPQKRDIWRYFSNPATSSDLEITIPRFRRWLVRKRLRKTSISVLHIIVSVLSFSFLQSIFIWDVIQLPIIYYFSIIALCSSSSLKGRCLWDVLLCHVLAMNKLLLSSDNAIYLKLVFCLFSVSYEENYTSLFFKFRSNYSILGLISITLTPEKVYKFERK